MGELELTVVLAAAVVVVAAALAVVGSDGAGDMQGPVPCFPPFGLSPTPQCHLPGFELFDLTCNTTHTPPPPRLLIGNDTLQLQVTNISLDNSTVRVLGPDIHTKLLPPPPPPVYGGNVDDGVVVVYEAGGSTSWGVRPWGLPGGSAGAYVLSESQSVLPSGCDLLAVLLLPGQGQEGRHSSHQRLWFVLQRRRNPRGRGAVQIIMPCKCNRGGGGGHCDSCSGIGCCKAPIAVGCDYYGVIVKGRSLVKTSIHIDPAPNYSVLIAEDGWSDQRNLKGPMALPEADKTRIPVVLELWAAVGGSDAAFQGPSDQTRDGNAAGLEEVWCLSSFSAYAGVPRVHSSGYTCKCSKGYHGNPYLSDGGGGWQGTSIRLSVGSVATLLILATGIMFLLHKIKKQGKREIRERFFKQNRGKLLQQLMCQRSDIAERMIIPLKELEKATNNFDSTRVLGGGAHGIVYKGILTSLHVVAIKKSKIVVQREIDAFINEVAILSQINHRNIVKLLGCCLETEVPLLVYEFMANGTLYDHLHVEYQVSIRWRDRLRIAVETARALAYLHSLVSVPIIHRDIKSPNILLDDNLIVKLSDFGASRHIPIEQTGVDTIVQGTFGYLDPTYFSTGHLTEKSDVYSFGVILIELLTRKKPVSYRSAQGYGLVKHFVTLVSESNLAHIIDPQVTREGGGEVVDVTLLAAICVKPNAEERPTMRQVEMTLEAIHAAKESVVSEVTDSESEDWTWNNNGFSLESTNNHDT